MNVEKGDSLFVTKTSNGIHLVRYEEAFAEQMKAAREVIRENRDVLRKLAESRWSRSGFNSAW